jgi:hypothetical protein
MNELLAEHQHYLADSVRLAAYERALAEMVRPGAVVLDLGAGSGILGLLACRAGAGRVYAVEEGPVIELARQVCIANGYQDRVVFCKSYSKDLVLPEHVDLIVADQVGFGSEYGIVRFFADLRSRLLRPGGVLMPTQIALQLAPVETPRMWAPIAFWQSSPAGFDLRPAYQLAIHTRYHTFFSQDELLSTPQQVACLDLASATEAPLLLRACCTALRSGMMHGIGGWFSAQLSPSVSITNMPGVSGAIQRQALFLPLEQPLEVVAGDQIQIQVHVRWSDEIYSWGVAIQQTAGGHGEPRIRQSTWHAQLLTATDLQRTEAGYRPQVTERGQARMLVLSLCDGCHNTAQIEQLLQQQHPNLFQSASDCAAFVAELVARNTGTERAH